MKQFICVVHLPSGPEVLTDLATDKPRLFLSRADARTKLAMHRSVQEYGGELFEVGKGLEL